MPPKPQMRTVTPELGSLWTAVAAEHVPSALACAPDGPPYRALSTRS